MAVIDKKSTTDTRGDYRLPADGPHRYVKKNVSSDREKDEAPPYVVAVKREEPTDPANVKIASSKYDPQELRDKAKIFLHSPQLPSDQKQVLQEILGPDEIQKPE